MSLGFSQRMSSSAFRRRLDVPFLQEKPTRASAADEGVRPTNARIPRLETYNTQTAALQGKGRIADLETTAAGYYRPLGILPIRGSLLAIRSQALNADSSKSGASAGRICEPVTFSPNTRMDRIFGKSRRRLS